MAWCINIGELVEISRMGAEELSVEWRIRDVLSLSGASKWYASPQFRIGHERWYLRLWPNYGREKWNPASGWLRLDLDRCDGIPPKTFRFSVGIKGSGGVEKRREMECEFSDFVPYYPWKNFCSRKELVEHRTTLMPDNILVITCVITMPSASGGILSHPHSSNQGALSNRSQSPDKQGCEKVHEDFSKLLESGENSDVTVQVGDVAFEVHRAILSARCPVLTAMFWHATEERASNSVKIDDCEPDVFREYLQYLYTGSVRSLSENNVFGLYCVADKYLADDLKQLCLEHIQATLSVQTFCDSMKLALTHGESGLLQLATDFASKNIRLLVRSVEWQNFIREHPTEANEIFIKSLSELSDSQ